MAPTHQVCLYLHEGVELRPQRTPAHGCLWQGYDNCQNSEAANVPFRKQMIPKARVYSNNGTLFSIKKRNELSSHPKIQANYNCLFLRERTWFVKPCGIWIPIYDSIRWETMGGVKWPEVFSRGREREELTEQRPSPGQREASASWRHSTPSHIFSWRRSTPSHIFPNPCLLQHQEGALLQVLDFGVYGHIGL